MHSQTSIAPAVDRPINQTAAAAAFTARAFEDAQDTRLAAGNRVRQFAGILSGIDTRAKLDEAQIKALDEVVSRMRLDFDEIGRRVRERADANNLRRANREARAAGVEVIEPEPIADEDAALVTRAKFDRAVAQDELPGGVLTQYAGFVTMLAFVEAERHEARALKALAQSLKGVPVWDRFLAGVKGVGPSLAGTIIATIDIHRAEYVSSLWRLAGYDVGPDGRGRSRRKEHLERRAYRDADGNEAERDSITFSPKLKTALHLAAVSFLKQGDRSPYEKVYRDTRRRLESHPIYGVHNDGKAIDGKGNISKGRRHAMALRAAIKRFLADLYREWRAIEGLPVAPEFSEAKLGMQHGSAEKYRRAA